MNKETMRHKLALLYKKAPELFDETVREYCDQGTTAIITPEHPRLHKGRTVMRTPSVVGHVQACVDFLVWRDGRKIEEVFDLLSRHGMHFTQYATEDNYWQVGKEPKPPTYDYRAEGKNPDGNNIKQTYHKHFDSKEDRQKAATQKALMYDLYVSAYEGRGFGNFNQEWLARVLPPKK